MNCIISIPQEAYNLIIGKIDTANLDLYSTLIQSVKNGIPLEQVRTEISAILTNSYDEGVKEKALQIIDKI